MKLSILLAGSILTSAIVGNAYAQTCGAQPSCADLGYTLTSTADCIGTPLKCPFDKTKYNCVTQNDIVPKWEGSIILINGIIAVPVIILLRWRRPAVYWGLWAEKVSVILFALILLEGLLRIAEMRKICLLVMRETGNFSFV